MRRFPVLVFVVLCATMLASARPVSAAAFFFSTGNVDGRLGSTTRPDAAGQFEIETGDDFVISGGTVMITSATFTGLLVGTMPSVTDLVVEIYRVFPVDSNVNRTSGPPNFSTTQVPTRVNSPSDVAFDSRELASNELSVTSSVLSSSFTVANSLTAGGIHPLPNIMTMGNGQQTGQEVQFNVTFNTPFVLPADHYFFVPQVLLSNGQFLWLSSVRPLVAPGTPFAPDLQAWARDAFLDPDWLRIGTDIIGGTNPPTFNMAFTLTGTVPEPGTMTVMGLGLIAAVRRRVRGNPINRG